MTTKQPELQKRATGVPGLDSLTRGGIPARSLTLLLGEPGAGKTVLGLQLLARAVERGEAAVFVSFEESRDEILVDAASFAWGDTLHQSDRFEIIDARPPVEADTAGSFDIGALLSALDRLCEQLQPSWFVLDGIDQLLRRQPNATAAIEQVRRLGDWCRGHDAVVLLTGKRMPNSALGARFLEGVEFMVPTVFVLSTEIVERRLNRRFRIAKYRGSGHVSDEMALLVDDDGIQLPYHELEPAVLQAGSERVTTGVRRLDKVLGGGLYRGSAALISGAPGTAKSTLSAAFAAAAAERGERVLFLSFDELEQPFVRNLTSVGIDLQPHIDSGHLRFHARSSWATLVEEHYLALLRVIDEFEPGCMVIDPVSALLKTGGSESAQVTTERLLDTARRRGMTTVMTSLADDNAVDEESTLSHVSTLADTWIVLGYNVRAGERNRTLSVVKSRGSAHSNQVRELLLSGEGVDLADVYEYGSEVLMGTARMEKRGEVEAERRRQELARAQRRRDLERQIEQARLRAEQASSEAERLRAELELEDQDHASASRETREHMDEIARRRDAGRDGEESS